MRMPQLVAAALLVAAAYSPARAETIEVVIDKLVFAPAEVNARVGDTVVWTNKDKFAHTATVKGGWEVMIPAGKSGSKLFYCNRRIGCRVF